MASVANSTLVNIPGEFKGDEKILEVLFPLTNVMGTEHHAALCAGVNRGVTCVVVGDGAAGLCAVLAAKRLGADRFIAVGHHAGRLETARLFGATDVVSGKDYVVEGKLAELTRGGADHVMECVGAASSLAACGWAMQSNSRPPGS
jgi:alcohol dehydrogenase